MTNVVKLNTYNAVEKDIKLGKQNLNDLHKEEARLERQFRKLARNFKKSKGNSNSVDVKTLQAFLALTLDLIPLAKTNYRQFRSDRSIYALNGLVNQAREIMNDLRQLKTGKKQHTHIVNKIILPNLQLTMQSYLNNMTELRQHVDKITDKKLREAMAKELHSQMQHYGSMVQEVSTKMQETLAEYLVG